MLRGWVLLAITTIVAALIAGCHGIREGLNTVEGRLVLTHGIESALRDSLPEVLARVSLRQDGFGRNLDVSLYPADGAMDAARLRTALTTVAATMPRGVASVAISAWRRESGAIDVHDAALAAGIPAENVVDRVSIVVDTAWFLDVYG